MFMPWLCGGGCRRGRMRCRQRGSMFVPRLCSGGRWRSVRGRRRRSGTLVAWFRGRSSRVGRGRRCLMWRCRWGPWMSRRLFFFSLIWTRSLSHPNRTWFGLSEACAVLCEKERRHHRARYQDVSQSLHKVVSPKKHQWLSLRTGSRENRECSQLGASLTRH